MMRPTLISIACGLLAGASTLAQGQQAYPTKPIRMLVGFPVGGGADVAARTLGPRMSELLGQQIIVDNRPGAGSSLASEMAAKSTPDGYTLVSIGSTHAVNAALNPKLPLCASGGLSCDCAGFHGTRGDHGESVAAGQIAQGLDRARQDPARAA